jgi:hypothetical protein
VQGGDGSLDDKPSVASASQRFAHHHPTLLDRRIDLARLAPRLAPFAARLGLPPRDGQSLLDHLLELGGVSDLIVAEQLVDVARVSNRTIGDLFAATINTRATEVAASILQNPAMLAAMANQDHQIQELIAAVLQSHTNLAAIVQSQLPPVAINPAYLQSKQLAAFVAALPRSPLVEAEAAAAQRNYSPQIADAAATARRQVQGGRT